MTMEKILTFIQSEYPHSFMGMDARTMKLKIILWEKEFQDVDINLVYAAMRIYMKRTERYAPGIGQIREILQSFLSDGELSETEAWALVSRAASNGYYHYEEEFRKLPPPVQRAVGRAEQLHKWSLMDTETFESVVASNFMRSFRAIQKREKETALLPENLRGQLQSEGMKQLGERKNL